jgi:flagellar biogenesis protein FliO
MGALAIVVGLIFVGRGLARKFVPGARASNGKGVVEILARHPLAKNQSIVLVRIGSQIVALNQRKESSESVLVISDTAEVARIIGQIEGKNPKSMQAGFTKLMANARLDLEEHEHADEEQDLKTMGADTLDEQLEEMAAAKRQLMELRQHVRSVRDSIPR